MWRGLAVTVKLPWDAARDPLRLPRQTIRRAPSDSAAVESAYELRPNAHISTADSGHDVPAAQPGVVDSVILQAAQAVH